MKRSLLPYFFFFAGPVCASEVGTPLIVSIDALQPSALSKR